MQLQKGDIIFDRALPPSLGSCSGAVLVLSPSGSRSLIMRELGRGYFRRAGLFVEETDYVTTLTAKSPCRVLFISQDLLRRAMAADFTLVENYIRFLSGRLRFLNRKISGLAACTAEEALAIYLSGLDSEVRVPSYSRLAEELGSAGRPCTALTHGKRHIREWTCHTRIDPGLKEMIQ